MRDMVQGKPKVLFLARWYPNRFDPMPGLFIRRHAMAVSAEYEVAVLYVHLNFDPEARLFETELTRENGLTEIKIYTRACRTSLNGFNSLVNLLRFLLAHWKGFTLLSAEFGKPSLIHVNVLTRCGFIAYMYRIFRRVPYVVTEHWTRYLPGMDNFAGAFRKLLTRLVVKNASAVLPVTMNLQKAMEKHGLTNSNYVVIPNVVDTVRFSPLKERSVSHEKWILHVSCFDDKQKNISGILRVMSLLAYRRQDWKCTLVGEGIHFDKMVEMAIDLHLKDKFVFFTGLREGDDLIKLMQKASFQLLFSRYENLPVVIPESFACGVPFISTDVGGISEHLHKELGILVPSEDENALLESLEYMLDHIPDYSSEAIRQYALEHFSREVIGKQIISVYNKVLGR